MGQWSGDSLGSPYSRGAVPTSQGATFTPAAQMIVPLPPPAPGPGPGRGEGRAFTITTLVVVVVLLVAVAVLLITYGRARSNLRTTRSALAASRGQLAVVQGALSGDTQALQAEQTVGIYMRGVRDALAPALAAYGASANASSAAGARANDEQAIAALTSAKQKINALVLLDSLKAADGDIRASIEALAGGLQSEVTAIGTGSLTGLDAALAVEGQALDHLQTALGEMYGAVGTTGPASGSS